MIINSFDEPVRIHMGEKQLKVMKMKKVLDITLDNKLLLLCLCLTSPTAKVIWRRGHGLKTNQTGW